VALPWLEAMGPRPAAPGRLVLVCIPLGFHSPNFFPAPAAPLPPYFKAAEALRRDFTIVSGTSHPEVDGGHDAEKSFLTASPHPSSRSFRNTISLDQFAAQRLGERTRYASLTLGEIGLSWSANGVPIPAEASPQAAYAMLFLQGSARDVAEQKRRLEDGRSVLDAVLEDAKGMGRALGAADREKLEQYFSAVRETERRLAKAGTWADTPKPLVKEPAPAPLKPEDVTGRLQGHFDVIRLALATDSTRVVALGGHGGSLVPPLKGVDQGYHALTHHGKNPTMVAQLEIIERETMRVWAGFLKALKETREGDATLLSRTSVLLGSNLGNANGHLTTNLPIVLAGGPFKHGRDLDFPGPVNAPLAKAFVSLLQGLGLEVDTFASGKGTLPGLEKA
jgi:hypothetical protein